jgi:hypothetical protein
LERDVIRQKVGQLFRLRPLPTFYTRDGNRLPFRDDLWVLRLASETEAEFKNRQTGISFKIELANLKEIRIPDYFILNCEITVKGETATLMCRKRLEEEFVRRGRLSEDASARPKTQFGGDREDSEI